MAERRRGLLAMTPIGQTVLDAERQATPAGTASFAVGTTARLVSGPRADGTITTMETSNETPAQRRKRLLQASPLGRAVLAAEAKAGK